MPGSVSQEDFNQVREARIIEALQAIARSPAGRSLAFKGGTALRLFWDLPRFSEDLDFARISVESPTRILKSLQDVGTQKGWEVTDAAVKRQTVLCEYRFRWEGPNFHLKIEVSLRAGKVPVAVQPLRGVPIIVLEEGRLTAEKLISFVDRDVARDAFDAFFILDKRLVIDRLTLKKTYGSAERYFDLALKKAESLRPARLANDVGKLLNADQRTWLRTSFQDDLIRLLRSKRA